MSTRRLVLAYDDWHGEPAEDLCDKCGHHRRIHRPDGCEACDGPAREHRFELGQAVRGVAVSAPPGREPKKAKAKRAPRSPFGRLVAALRERREARAARRKAKRQEAKRFLKTATRR